MKQIIEFTIYGNQEHKSGNPIPKIKKTARQQWTPAAQRYGAWKIHVQEAFEPALIAAAIDMPEVPARKIIGSGGGRYLKPITIDENIRMDILIYWADETHADPESIFGSIADALFVQDKHLKGSMDFVHAKDRKGKVEVKITIG